MPRECACTCTCTHVNVCTRSHVCTCLFTRVFMLCARVCVRARACICTIHHTEHAVPTFIVVKVVPMTAFQVPLRASEVGGVLQP
jgi:hypothetical protein